MATMKRARMFVDVDSDGKILRMTSSSNMVLLADNQVPMTPNELAILRIVNGDLNFARDIIRDIEKRIAEKLSEKE